MTVPALARRSVLPLAMALALGACAGSGDSTSDAGSSPDATSPPATVGVSLPEREMSAQDATRVDRAVKAADPLAVSPGYWVGVYDPDKGYYEQAYGQAEVGGEAAAVDQVFRIGSITKTFTATLVLQLVDEGELTLDQTVAEASPDTAEKFPDTADTTVRALLSMQSGVQDYMNVADGIVAQTAADPTTVYDADTLIQAGLDAGEAPPGTYSTTNYILLQEILESKTGATIQELIQTRITDPLGMTVAAMPTNDDTTLPEPATHGYVNAGCAGELQADGATGIKPGADTSDWNASYGQGGGGMHSNIRDLGIWALSGSGNALLSDDIVAERLATEDLNIGLPYGLGIFRVGDWVGHEGEAIGWEALSFYNPETNVAIAFGTNACNGNFAEFLQITDALYPDTGLSDWLR